jgi:hypothetical protein
MRYVSASDPQRVKNTPAVASLTCLATKGLQTPRDETDEICGLSGAVGLGDRQLSAFTQGFG